jgi:two-component system CheB/CheR fusion protein
LLLIVVMAAVAVLVAGIALGMLYRAALGEERARLRDTVESQAHLIESVARFHRRHQDRLPRDPDAASLEVIEDAHQQYQGFGATGGFAFARREGDKIVYLHSHRAGLEPPEPVPFDSRLAEAMRRALQHEEGTTIGPDYAGTEVVAAYRPLDELEMGIVAKIDLAEVRAPFVRAGMAAAAAGLVVVLLGTALFVKLTTPVIRQLRESEQLSESIVNTAQNIVLVLDHEGRIVRFNPYMEDLTGWRLEEVRGRDWFETFLPTADRQPTRQIFGRAIAGERTRGNVNPILTKDGREREIEWYDAPLTDAHGRLIGLLCTGLDITERRSLEREILEIAADEQRRIGQELHDGTQQQLTGLGLLAQNIAVGLARMGRRLEGGEQVDEGGFRDSIERLHQRVLQVQNGLEQAARDVHQLARGLIPVEVDSRGLLSALAELVRGLNDLHRGVCTFHADGSIELADNFAATHLFRIAQEAITNALKHSRARRIEITLGEAADSIRLEILDDGRGIGTPAAAGSGMGLRIMAYRAELIGAALEVGPRNGGGTQVVCKVRRK